MSRRNNNPLENLKEVIFNILGDILGVINKIIPLYPLWKKDWDKIYLSLSDKLKSNYLDNKLTIHSGITVPIFILFVSILFYNSSFLQGNWIIFVIIIGAILNFFLINYYLEKYVNEKYRELVSINSKRKKDIRKNVKKRK